jgi:pimeloyl-ACP methyl ester carboxylesterase
MPEMQLPAIRLYYDEHGTGAPILLIPGTGSDADAWGAASGEPARLGRVIVYDRRGCTRSERPAPYQRTTPAEQADDAAALLEGLGALPAIVIGRSYGGEVALQLAARFPERVRALVLLEGGGLALSPEVGAFLARMADRIRAAFNDRGPEAAGEVLLRTVLGDAGYEAASAELKARVAANGPAIVAEMDGLQDDQLEAGRLGEITCPALVVTATSSPAPFRRLSEALAAALPDARLALVEGGHLISPADAHVVGFLQEVLARS